MIALGFLAAARYIHILIHTYTLHFINFYLCIGLLPSLFFSVRVSNELGSGNPKGAKFATLTAVFTSLSLGIVLFFVFLFLRGRVSYIFTTSEAVAAEVADLSPLLAFSILMNSVQPVLSGMYIS